MREPGEGLVISGINYLEQKKSLKNALHRRGERFGGGGGSNCKINVTEYVNDPLRDLISGFL